MLAQFLAALPHVAPSRRGAPCCVASFPLCSPMLYSVLLHEQADSGSTGFAGRDTQRRTRRRSAAQVLQMGILRGGLADRGSTDFAGRDELERFRRQFLSATLFFYENSAVYTWRWAIYHYSLDLAGQYGVIFLLGWSMLP